MKKPLKYQKGSNTFTVSENQTELPKGLIRIVSQKGNIRIVRKSDLKTDYKKI